jgi:4-hydroxy-3-polyprenylbenzoate decarboxylase
VTVHDWRDLAAPVASGSFPVRAMVVVPCSMGTIGRLAAGLSGNLIERAADVSLKEGRPLVLVPRETPLGQIHLRNLLELSRAGAIILPAMPGFYHRPRTVEEVADHVVLKIMDRLGLPCERVKRWGVEPEPAE